MKEVFFFVNASILTCFLIYLPEQKIKKRKKKRKESKFLRRNFTKMKIKLKIKVLNEYLCKILLHETCEIF